MNKKIAILVQDSFNQKRKKSLVDNIDYWCQKRGIEYEYHTIEELNNMNTDHIGAVYVVLSTFLYYDLAKIPKHLPVILDVATIYKGDDDLFVGQRFAFRSAFAMNTGPLNPELQVPMIPRPIKPVEGVTKDVIIFDVKDFHNEETHFYVMSLLAQVAREWLALEKAAGHKLYLYFTSFMKYEEYVKVFDLLEAIPQFAGAKMNMLKKMENRVIPPLETTDQYHDVLHRGRLFITEHGDIADTDLAQVLVLGTPVLTYKRVPFATSTGIQHTAKEGAVLLHDTVTEKMKMLNKFRVREEWGLKNIIRIESVPRWDFDDFESLFLKTWDTLWDWALNNYTNPELSEVMVKGKWNKGVKLDKKLYNELMDYKKKNSGITSI